MMLTKHLSCLTMLLRCLHKSFSGPGAEELLHLTIACLNSSFEKEFYRETSLQSILLRISMLIGRFWAVLNVLWSAFHRLSRDKHGWPLCLMVSVAGSLHLLIQFVSSQGPFFLLAISWIFSLKYDLLTFLTTLLKFFLFSRDLEVLLFWRAQPHLSDHHCLECLDNLDFLALFFHAWLMINPSRWTTLSNLSELSMLLVDKVLKFEITSLMKAFS